MLNVTFLKNKISRQIKQNGMSFEFTRYAVDNYSQRTSEKEKVFLFDGIFHRLTQNQISLTISEASKIPTKTFDSILCLYDDGKEITMDDEVVISGNRYKVVDKINVNSFDVAFEILLEIIKDEF